MHAHCSLDPVDYKICRYSPEKLIEMTAKFGYEVLSITCHNRDIWTAELADYAESLGITLIPGMEVSVEGTRHVLVYNFHGGSENLDTLSKIDNRSEQDTLVIAPHSFFPGSSCLRRLLENNLDSFDAIECSGFLIRGIDFNRKSIAIARKSGKPLVACGDIHYLWQLNRTVTWIYAEPNVSSILHAIKQGMVRIRVTPISWFEAIKWWATTRWRHAFPVNPAPPKHALNKLFPAR